MEDWEIIENTPSHKEVERSEAIVNGNKHYYKKVRLAIYYFEILKEMACVLKACVTTSSFDECRYENPEQYCSTIVKINPKTSQRLYAHADLTSCHVAPSKYGSWIKVWKAATNYCKDQKVPCSFSECSGEGILGAHVWYVGSIKKYASWYIAPACHNCNRQHGKARRLKSQTAIVKVVDGKIFSPNEILIGSIQTSLIVKRKRPKKSVRKDTVYPEIYRSGEVDSGAEASYDESQSTLSDAETPQFHEKRVIHFKLPKDALRWRTPESRAYKKCDKSLPLMPAERLPVKVVP